METNRPLVRQLAVELELELDVETNILFSIDDVHGGIDGTELGALTFQLGRILKLVRLIEGRAVEIIGRS